MLDRYFAAGLELPCDLGDLKVEDRLAARCARGDLRLEVRTVGGDGSEPYLLDDWHACGDLRSPDSTCGFAASLFRRKRSQVAHQLPVDNGSLTCGPEFVTFEFSIGAT